MLAALPEALFELPTTLDGEPFIPAQMSALTALGVLEIAAVMALCEDENVSYSIVK
jgi:hypothetical protein